MPSAVPESPVGAYVLGAYIGRGSYVAGTGYVAPTVTEDVEILTQLSGIPTMRSDGTSTWSLFFLVAWTRSTGDPGQAWTGVNNMNASIALVGDAT